MICCRVPEGRKHLCKLPDGPKALLKGGVSTTVLLSPRSASVLCGYCPASLRFQMTQSSMHLDSQTENRMVVGQRDPFSGHISSCRLIRRYSWEQPQGYDMLSSLEGLRHPGHWVWCAHAGILCRRVTVMTSGSSPHAVLHPAPSGLMDKFLLSRRRWGGDSLWFHSRM